MLGSAIPSTVVCHSLHPVSHRALRVCSCPSRRGPVFEIQSRGLRSSTQATVMSAVETAVPLPSASGASNTSKLALISLSDKSGLWLLGKGLHDLGYTLVSTGGTATTLEKLGLSVTTVEELTSSPEMLGGPVKTLHPNIHGGILARRDQVDHLEDLAKHGISELPCPAIYHSQIV